MGFSSDVFKKRTKYLNTCVVLFLDPSSSVTSRYCTRWSAIQELSLHVVPRKHQQRRNRHVGSILAGNNCHEWTLCWRPSAGDNLACLMLNDSQSRFVKVREVTQPQHWLKYVEKFCEVLFRESLESRCRRSLGVAHHQSTMAAHEVTQPLPACSSLLYWKWTGKTILMASSKVIL